MLDYRVFVLDHDGHIVVRHDLLCEDDADAMEQARQYVDGSDVELWRRERRVAVLRHTD